MATSEPIDHLLSTTNWWISPKLIAIPGVASSSMSTSMTDSDPLSAGAAERFTGMRHGVLNG